MTRTGQCCCGESEIEVTDNPVLNCICNCSNCKKRTGSAFGVSAYFTEANFKITKDSTSTYQRKSESGEQVRNFCNKCGTTLFWKVEALKGLVGVAAGCFTDKPLPAPNYNAFMDAQCSWVSFSESVKPLTAQDIPSV